MGGGGEFMSKPLLIRRRCGVTDPAVLAGEVTILAAVGVGGVTGGHAMSLSLRGASARPVVLLL